MRPARSGTGSATELLGKSDTRGAPCAHAPVSAPRAAHRVARARRRGVRGRDHRGRRVAERLARAHAAGGRPAVQRQRNAPRGRGQATGSATAGGEPATGQLRPRRARRGLRGGPAGADRAHRRRGQGRPARVARGLCGRAGLRGAVAPGAPGRGLGAVVDDHARVRARGRCWRCTARPAWRCSCSS